MNYIVYQITNLVNNKIYIGAHKTTLLDDGYMSSSKVVKSALKKYGKDNFKKEILHVFDNEVSMFAKEAAIVNDEFINRKDTYNLTCGGTGSTTHLNNILKKEHSARSKRAGKLVKNRYDLSQHTETRFSEDKELQRRALEKSKSPEARQKRKETFKRNKIGQGKNNSQYGTAIYLNPAEPKVKQRFKKGKEPNGWILSTVYTEQRMKNSKRWYNDGKRNYYIVLPNLIIEELSLVKGRIKSQNSVN